VLSSTEIDVYWERLHWECSILRYLFCNFIYHLFISKYTTDNRLFITHPLCLTIAQKSIVLDRFSVVGAVHTVIPLLAAGERVKLPSLRTKRTLKSEVSLRLKR
jgi:hypothetical protein